jgi:SAM-dependent methyltransferase
MSQGERRYRLDCLDKLSFTFRGDESVLDAGCGNGGVARLIRERVREMVAIVEEALERLPLLRPLLSHYFAVA